MGEVFGFLFSAGVIKIIFFLLLFAILGLTFYIFYLAIFKEKIYKLSRYKKLKAGEHPVHHSFQLISFQEWFLSLFPFFRNFAHVKVKKHKHYSFFESLWLLAVHHDFKTVRRFFVFYLIFALVFSSVGVYYLSYKWRYASALTVTDSTAADFNAGTYLDTQYNNTNNWVELTATGKSNGSGEYTSSIKNLGPSSYNNISWVPYRPIGKALPDFKATETGYSANAVDMSNNVLLLHFNEAAGASFFTDTSGNTNDGTCSGGACPVSGVAGIYASAVQFDGTDDLIDCGTSGFVTSPPFTIEAWVKFNSNTNSTGYMYVARGSGLGGGDMFVIARRNSDRALYYVEASTPRIGPVVLDNVWTHIVFVFNSTTPYVEAYVNGSPVSITQPSAPVDPGAAVGCSVGGWTTSVLHPLDGVVDEVAMYTRALSASEVYDRYIRSLSKLKFQIRSCDDPACSGEIFVGPDGTASTFYEWGASTSNTTPSFSITNLVDNTYFQYKVFFETSDSAFTPELMSVTIDYTPVSVGGGGGAGGGGAGGAVLSKPINKSPLDGEIVFTVNPDLVASAFSSTSGSTHTATEWQVDDESDFSSIVWSRLSSSGEISTTINNSKGKFQNELVDKQALVDGATYYWRVRYQDSNGVWSDWSDPTKFTVDRSKKAIDVRVSLSNATPAPGEKITIDAQVQDSLTSEYLSNIDVRVSVYDPTDKKILEKQKMDYVLDSQGLYTYSYTTPSITGDYIVEVEATKGLQYGKGTTSFKIQGNIPATIFRPVVVGSSGRVYDFKGEEGEIIITQINDVDSTRSFSVDIISKTDTKIGKDMLVIFIDGRSKGEIRKITSFSSTGNRIRIDEAVAGLREGEKALIYTGSKKIDGILLALRYVLDRLREEEDTASAYDAVDNIYDLIKEEGEIDPEFLEANFAPEGIERYEKKDLVNKIEDLRAVARLIKAVKETDGKEALYVQWYTFGSVNLQVVAVNPTRGDVNIPVKVYLPKEIESKDVLDNGVFDIKQEDNTESLYAYYSLRLRSKQARKLMLKMRDVWDFDVDELLQYKKEAASLLNDITADSEKKRAQIVKQQIDSLVDNSYKLRDYLTAEEKIIAYRKFNQNKSELMAKVRSLENLYAAQRGLFSFAAFLAGGNVYLGVGILFTTVLGVIVVWIFLYALWRHQMKVTIELVRTAKSKKIDDKQLQYYLNHPIMLEDIKEGFMITFGWVAAVYRFVRKLIRSLGSRVILLLMLIFLVFYFSYASGSKIVDLPQIFSKAFSFKEFSLFGKRFTVVEDTSLSPTPAPTDTPTPTPAPEVKKLIILQTPTGYLNVRKGPGVNYQRIDRVFTDEEYEYIDTDLDSQGREWYEIKLKDGNTGWVIGRYIEVLR